MIRAYEITSFKPASSPCREAVSKFGGQPVWIAEPQWPLSSSSGEQMKFICQVQLYPELFGPLSGKMAYVFMTDLEQSVVPAWDPDAGENAVVIQPGRPLPLKTSKAALGPTLYEYLELPGEAPQPRPCEYLPELAKKSEPDFVDEAHRSAMDDRSFEEYSRQIEGNKFGGTPAFLQEDANPASGHLLLQLDSSKVPFYINFGDCGVGYAFISPDGSAGRFLFQSY